MGAKKVSSISQANTLENMGEFWDIHDFTDVDNPETPDVHCRLPAPRRLNVSYGLMTGQYCDTGMGLPLARAAADHTCLASGPP
jgi:hypothetical protein